MSVLEAKSNHDLFATEDGLLKMHKARVDAGWDTAEIVTAYGVLKAEMAERGLFTKGLPESATPGKNKPSAKDGDNDDQDDAEINTGAGTPSNSEDRGKASDSTGTEKQTPKAKVTHKDGPVVVKQDGPPPKANHPSQDDGINTKTGTKRGKGGEAHRFLQQVGSAGEGGVDGDDETLEDDGVTVRGKAKQNKSGGANEISYANRNMGKAAPTSGTTRQSEAGPTSSTAPSKPMAPAKATASGTHRDAPAESDYTPHPFAPSEAIASICGTCGRAIADHVGKFLGADDSRAYAAYVVKAFELELQVNGKADPNATLLLKRDFSSDERRGYAESGVALPDGSFPIPDEASLHNAVRLVGHGQDPEAAMRHIIERAKTMGMAHALPPAWNVQDAGADEGGEPKPGAHELSPSGSGGAAGGKSKGTSSGAPAKKSVLVELAKAFAKGLDDGMDVADVLESLEAATSPDFEQYAVIKSDAKRYTLGPVYMPKEYDAHGEWTTAEELFKAKTDYVAETGADRTVFLQHTDRPAGQWVDIVQWPFPVRAQMLKSVDGVQKAVSMELPADTVYMGVVWEPWAWEDVKKERITGFSMGGWAKRLEAEIAS